MMDIRITRIGVKDWVEHRTYMDHTHKVSGLSIVDIIYGARINDESISDPHIYDAYVYDAYIYDVYI